MYCVQMKPNQKHIVIAFQPECKHCTYVYVNRFTFQSIFHMYSIYIIFHTATHTTLHTYAINELTLQLHFSEFGVNSTTTTTPIIIKYNILHLLANLSF